VNENDSSAISLFGQRHKPHHEVRIGLQSDDVKTKILKDITNEVKEKEEEFHLKFGHTGGGNYGN
jgi:urease accessory protein UreE